MSEPVIPISPSPTIKDWLPAPDTQLYVWEIKVRQDLEQIDWFGQLEISRAQFEEICAVIRGEARGKKANSPEIEEKLERVPAAVFIASLVFSARYAELGDDEDSDEFWKPYCRTVWKREYDTSFYNRCRKRFGEATLFLEANYGLSFQNLANTSGEVVTPVFRHALLPQYVQEDFAVWLSKQWVKILDLRETPQRLIKELKHERSLSYLSARLQKFVQGEKTAATAAALIITMAVALRLYIEERESAESVAKLLTGVERDVWHKIGEHLQQEETRQGQRLVHTRQGHLIWVWDIEEQKMGLRFRDYLLPANQKEPLYAQWRNKQDDILAEEPIYADLLESGAWRINQLFLPYRAHSSPLTITIEDDYGEKQVVDNWPALPTAAHAPIQFFRLTQQDVFGIPIAPEQVSDGVWLVCASQPLVVLKDGQPIEPDKLLNVPYPLDEQGGYAWAAEFSLHLPVDIHPQQSKPFTLQNGSGVPAVGRPKISGKQPIAGLSPHLPPLFASTAITIEIAYGTARLLRQGSLIISGQGERDDHWMVNLRLAEWQGEGFVEPKGDKLYIHLQDILPAERADVYRIELRYGLQSIWPAAQEVGVVPNLQLIKTPLLDVLYTPANPPELRLTGVTEQDITPRLKMEVNSLNDDDTQIVWHDLRQDPQLRLQFDNRTVLLAWPIRRCAIWLARPNKSDDSSFITLAEAKQTRLHALATKGIEQFSIWIDTQVYSIQFDKRHGRYEQLIGQTQLYEVMYQHHYYQALLEAEVNGWRWKLAEIRKKPKLGKIKVEYDNENQLIVVQTDLEESWSGHGRVFALPIYGSKTLHNLGEIDALGPIIYIACTPPNGRYTLSIEFNGEQILGWLREQDKQFTVTESTASPTSLKSRPSSPHIPQNLHLASLYQLFGDNSEIKLLVETIQQEHRVKAKHAEMFLEWQIDLALQEKISLTPVLLWQLATLSGEVLLKFENHQLTALWSALSSLQEIHEPRVIEAHHQWAIWQIISRRRAFGDEKVIVESRSNKAEPPPVMVNNLRLTQQQWSSWWALGHAIQQWEYMPHLMHWHRNAGRILHVWRNGKPNLPKLVQLAFILGLLLRTAAYHPDEYTHLLRKAEISDETVKQLLHAFQQNIPKHLIWGLTWAELIYIHSYSR